MIWTAAFFFLCAAIDVEAAITLLYAHSPLTCLRERA